MANTGTMNNQTLDAWQEKVLKDLRGKPLESIYWETRDGIVLNPLNTEGSYHSFDRIADAGAWEMAESQSADNLLLDALKWGVSFIRVRQINESFKDIYGNMVRFGLPLDGNLETLKQLQSACNEPIANEDLAAVIETDPITDFLKKGGTQKDLEASLNTWATNAQRIAEEFPGCDVLSLDLCYLTQCGATNITVLRHALQLLEIYGEAAEAKGLNAEGLFKRTRIRMGVSSRLLENIASIRAMRGLWNAFMQAQSIEFPCRIDAIVPENLYADVDPESNILRATAGAMGAAAASAASIEIPAYDIRSAGDHRQASRIARNIHHVLMNESNFDKLSDPGGGAYAIEQYTEQLMERAWNSYAEVGDPMLFILSGALHDDVKGAAERHLDAILSGNAMRIGVNKYQPEGTASSLSLETPAALENEIPSIPKLDLL